LEIGEDYYLSNHW